MRFIIILLLNFFLLLSTTMFAQKEDYVWPLGNNGGSNYGQLIEDMKDSVFRWTPFNFDFNSDPFKIEYRLNRKANLRGTLGSICDREGKLFCYGHARSIWNNADEYVINGDTIGFDEYWQLFENTNYSLGYKIHQGMIILPYPGKKDSVFYISPRFNLDQEKQLGIYWGIISGYNRETAPKVVSKDNFVDNPWNIPNFPYYRLGPLDGSSCDTLGIDNHPIAKYRYEADTSDHLRIRFTDLSYFRPEIWSWDYGDGSPKESIKSPYHSFQKNGTYQVCLTVSNENSSNTTCRTLTLGTSSTSEDIGSKADIHLFPNPVTDLLLITIGDYIPEHGQAELFDLKGQMVL
jgi:hypothetical protein